MNRRQFICTATAAVTVAATPFNPPLAVEATAPVVALTPAWAVGTPGEFDWQWIVAKSEREARIQWAMEKVGDDECGEGGVGPKDDCDCEFCGAFHQVEADRQPKWDGKSVKAGDWLRVGLGSLCSRCSYETFEEEGAHAVGDEAVCGDCMTLADWNIVDPERAAEIREEIADEAVPAAVALTTGDRRDG